MFRLYLILLFIYPLMNVQAAETMTDHSHMQHGSEHDNSMTESREQAALSEGSIKESPSLDVLRKAPASGKAREAGFDKSYIMKQTTVDSGEQEKCILASRGIIMLDRAGWKNCGVKVKQAQKQSTMSEHGQHQGH